MCCRYDKSAPSNATSPPATSTPTIESKGINASIMQLLEDSVDESEDSVSPRYRDLMQSLRSGSGGRSNRTAAPNSGNSSHSRGNNHRKK